VFSPLRQGSVRTQVAEALRKAIYAGKLRPGDPLLEMQLAKDLRVSQTSVREALLQLEQLGLVRRFPNKGTQVTNLSSKEIRERLDIRVQLECMAAIQAAPHVGKREAKELRRLADLIGEATADGDYGTGAQADLQFHSTMWECSGNTTISQVLHQVSAPLFAFVSILRTRSSRNLKIVLHSHREIVDALLDGEPARIRTTVENHFADSYEQLMKSNDAAAKRLNRSVPASASQLADTASGNSLIHGS